MIAHSELNGLGAGARRRVTEEEPAWLCIEVETVARHPNTISTIESNHGHGHIGVLDLQHLVHIIQRIGRISPSRVTDGHNGSVAILDDLDIVTVVNHGEVLVIKPGVLGVLHGTGLGDDFRTDQDVPVAERLFQRVFEGTVQVGRLHREGAVVDGLIVGIDERNGHAAVLVIEVLVEVHAGVESTKVPIVVQQVDKAVVIERARLRERRTRHVKSATEVAVLRGGEEGDAFLKTGGLGHGTIETVTSEDIRSVEVVEE